ncbi:amidohydrolase family protein [Salinicola sp. 4072]|jgi:predicted TIM-barrel fold metal-dependent hydrolase|uniref:amidohydrolase family protein n=1 Tax=Salinicola TaxID=404432 RepID=UPI000B4019D0|nr:MULTISPECIES: amidohydrolase family protein [Salinicola]
MTQLASVALTGVDTHAHIFHQGLELAGNRRYSPDYDATVEQYLAHLDHCGLSHGVLVQPSFLGTDNRHLVDALRRFPQRLRGTAVVARDVTEETLDELAEAGVVGIRLNLIGQPLEDYRSASWRTLFAKVARLGWSVEIQRGVEDLGEIVPQILQSGVAVVIDHFGLPDGEIDPANSDHRTLLSLLPSEAIWIKLSATYRSRSTPAQARRSIERLRDAYGHGDRLVWGSDWPHTRFEAHTDYDAQFSLMETLLPDAAERRKILIDNPARLFGIDRAA